MRELFSEGGAPFSAKLLRSLRRRPTEGMVESKKRGRRKETSAGCNLSCRIRFKIIDPPGGWRIASHYFRVIAPSSWCRPEENKNSEITCSRWKIWQPRRSELRRWRECQGCGMEQGKDSTSAEWAFRSCNSPEFARKHIVWLLAQLTARDFLCYCLSPRPQELRGYSNSKNALSILFTVKNIILN